jgi:hypothetical protein
MFLFFGVSNFINNKKKYLFLMFYYLFYLMNKKILGKNKIIIGI